MSAPATIAFSPWYVAGVLAFSSLFGACGDDAPQPDAGTDAAFDAATDAVDAIDGAVDAPDSGTMLEEGELHPGGDTTTSSVDGSAFLQQAANLSLARRAGFEAGLQFFRLPWEVAPGRPEADGLGPTFNARSCIECHVRNGRGIAEDGNPGVLVRLGRPDGSPDPAYGGQFQHRAIRGVPREGDVSFEERTVRTVSLPEGDVVLSEHIYTLSSLAFGPLHEDTGLSPRVTPQLVGMGLLDAIAEEDVLSWEDPEDNDENGISGRAARLGETLGRFGWKSGQPTALSQCAAAFLGDLGLTSPLFPDENCPAPQTACQAAPNGGSVELNETRMRLTAEYVSLLGVPTRRDAEAVLAGKQLFGDIGCANCHRPSFTTGDSPFEELEGQRIWPYTDLLLHDMGPELAGPPEGDAAGAEWRTPPLWGLGLSADEEGRRHLLHDGRADSLDEAILWHSGEGERARAAYEALTPTERQALRAFVESL